MLPATLLLSILAPIDFSCPPTCLADLKPRLEQLVAKKIRLEPDRKNEVVVLRATKVDRQEILDHIARSVCGVWLERADHLVLETDHKEKRSRLSRLENKLSTGYHTLIQSRLIDLRNKKVDSLTPKELARRFHEADPDTSADFIPITRAAWKAIDLISRQNIDWHGLRSHSYPVYSSDPLHGQFPLPVAAEQLLTTSLRETLAFSDTLAALGYIPDFDPQIDLDSLGSSRWTPQFPLEGWTVELKIGPEMSVRWIAQGDRQITLTLADVREDVRRWFGDNEELAEQILPSQKLADRFKAYEAARDEAIAKCLARGSVARPVPTEDFLAWKGFEADILADQPERDYCFNVNDDFGPYGQSLFRGYEIVELGTWISSREWMVDYMRGDRCDRVLFRHYMNTLASGRTPRIEDVLASHRTRVAWATVLYYGADYIPMAELLLAQSRLFTAHPSWPTSGHRGLLSGTDSEFRRDLIGEEEYAFDWEFRQPDGSWKDFDQIQEADPDISWPLGRLPARIWNQARIAIHPRQREPISVLFKSKPFPGHNYFLIDEAKEGPDRSEMIFCELMRDEIVVHIDFTEDLRLVQRYHWIEGRWPTACPPKAGVDLSSDLRSYFNGCLLNRPNI